MVESSYLLAENSTFKATLQLDDKKYIAYSASKFALFLKINMFAIIDIKGNVIYDLNDKITGNNISTISAVKSALKGIEPPVEFNDAHLLRSSNQIFQIVAVPVYAGKDTILGVILMGVNIDKFLLQPLARSRPFNLLFYYKKTLQSLTDPSLTALGISFERMLNTTMENKYSCDKLNDLQYNGSNVGQTRIFKQCMGISKNGLLLSIMPEKKSYEPPYFWEQQNLLSNLAILLIFNTLVAFCVFKITD